MRQVLTLSFLSILFVTCATAQNNGTLSDHFNAGIGISGYGIPIYGSYDVNVAQDINVGGGLSFQTHSNSWGNSFASAKYRHTIIGINGLGYYYFNRILEIPAEYDFYGGASLGFYIWNTKRVSSSNGFNESYGGSGSGGLGLSLLVGGRYYFKENLGVNLELGGGNVMSGAKLGLTWKL